MHQRAVVRLSYPPHPGVAKASITIRETSGSTGYSATGNQSARSPLQNATSQQVSVKISIIIPVLNEAANIEQALHRAWATGPHAVIVVDGGSTDATVELADKLASQVIRSSRGRGTQQNLGARHATGEVLLFLHADNWLAPDGLRQLLAALLSRDVTFGAFRQRIEAPGRRFRLLERGNAYRVARWGLPYGDQGIFLPKQTFDELGGFPDVPLMEDVLLSRTLRRRGWPVLLPGPLHVSPRRWQQYGVVRQTVRNWMLLAALNSGCSPARLASFYPANK